MTNRHGNLQGILDDELLRSLERRAHYTGQSVSTLVNEALRAQFPVGEFESDQPDAASPEQDSSKGYFAFISYSHDDEAVAATLHKRLERFRVPRPLIGTTTGMGEISGRIRPVFRDQEEFSASADLGQSIRKALRASRVLLVVCSPRSAQSKWVGEEIRHFKQLGGVSRILCLVVEGEPVISTSDNCQTAAFHPALGEVVQPVGQHPADPVPEPLGIDLHDEEMPRAVVKIAAGVLGVGFDELHQRVRRQKRRSLGLLAVLAMAIMATVAGLMLETQREKQWNRAQQLALTATEDIYEKDPLLGMGIALQAIAIAPDSEGNEMLLDDARELLTRGRIAGPDTYVVQAPDGNLLSVDRGSGHARFISIINGGLIQTLAFSPGVITVEFPTGRPDLILTRHERNAQLWRLGNGTLIATLKPDVSEITFGPDHFFVNYSGGYTNELRRYKDGEVMPLTVGGKPSAATFSVGDNAGKVVIEYGSGRPAELRSIVEGSLVALPQTAKSIQFSPDKETRRLLVNYMDGSADLLRTADLSVVRRFDANHSNLRFAYRGPGDATRGMLLYGQHNGVSQLNNGLDGAVLTSGGTIKRSRDGSRSMTAVHSPDRVEWFRASDARRLASISGEFAEIKFGDGDPVEQISLKAADGWREYLIEDGTPRLPPPSVATSTGGSTISHFPLPSTRNIVYQSPLGPGSAYHMVVYIDDITKIMRTDDAVTVVSIPDQATGADQFTFLPGENPTHVLYQNTVYPLADPGPAASPVAVATSVAPVNMGDSPDSIELLPPEEPRYLLLGYIDGRTALWTGLQDMRRLTDRDYSFTRYSYSAKNSTLVLWNGDSAEIIDLNWLERANAQGITESALYRLACEGPLTHMNLAELQELLQGESWVGCDAIYN